MSIKGNLKKIHLEIEKAAERAHRKASEITLIAVTKGQSVATIEEAFAAGCQEFGENRVQEALPKLAQAKPEMHWHFIGTLQKNKVAKVVGRFVLIHSVDSLELAEKISLESEKKGVRSSILLESNTSSEASKRGKTPEEWLKCFDKLLRLPGIVVQGFMTMAPFTEDEKVIRNCFSSLRQLKEKVGKDCFPILSMGMSNDFVLAVEEGATHLRIGTRIFEVSTDA